MRLKNFPLGLIAFAVFDLSLTSQSQAQNVQAQKSGPVLSERAQKGKDVFTDRCFVCHDVDSPRVKPLGPSLNGLYKKEKLVSGKPVNDANVKEQIKIGPTPNMPGFRYTLTDQQIDDLIEYLKVK